MKHALVRMYILFFSNHRCLFVYLWMRIWTAWCLSPSNPKRKSMPLSCHVSANFLSLVTEPENAFEHTWSRVVAPPGWENRPQNYLYVVNVAQTLLPFNKLNCTAREFSTTPKNSNLVHVTNRNIIQSNTPFLLDVLKMTFFLLLINRQMKYFLFKFSCFFLLWVIKSDIYLNSAENFT